MPTETAPASAAEVADTQANAQECSTRTTEPSPAEIKFDRGVPTRDQRRKIMSSSPREPGNAIDHYIIDMQDSADVYFDQRIDFQSQIEPDGINGVTVENLLEICADRLRSFQAGKFPCEANMAAIKDIEDAMRHLYARTAEREARGVEGKHEA